MVLGFNQPGLTTILQSTNQMLSVATPQLPNPFAVPLTEPQMEEQKKKCKTDYKPKDPCILAVKDLIKRIHEHI
jgi:hypothetical protein